MQTSDYNAKEEGKEEKEEEEEEGADKDDKHCSLRHQ